MGACVLTRRDWFHPNRCPDTGAAKCVISSCSRPLGCFMKWFNAINRRCVLWEQSHSVLCPEHWSGDEDSMLHLTPIAFPRPNTSVSFTFYPEDRGALHVSQSKNLCRKLHVSAVLSVGAKAPISGRFLLFYRSVTLGRARAVL